MAFSWQESVKPAGTQDIQCDIEYLDKSYIHVYLDGAETTAFTWTSSTNIRLNSPLSVETAVLLIRKTEREYLYIEFASGAPFIEGNVDTQNTQFLHLAQELVEGRSIEGFYGDINMHRYRITNLGDPVDARDAANKQYVDAGDARLDQRIDAEHAAWAAAVANEAAIRKAADDALDVRTTNLEQTYFNANTNSFPWWTVLTEDTDTVTPDMPFTKAKVRVNGVTQTAGYSYTVNAGVVKFAEVLPAGTLVDMTIGIDTEADTSAVSTILGMLSDQTLPGTSLVRHSSGYNVAQLLSYNVPEAASVAELRTRVGSPGWRIKLREYSAGAGPQTGGELVWVSNTTYVDDGVVFFRVNSSGGWIRNWSNGINAEWAGPIVEVPDASPALNRISVALKTFNAEVKLPAGNIYVGDTWWISTGQLKVTGCGSNTWLIGRPTDSSGATTNSPIMRCSDTRWDSVTVNGQYRMQDIDLRDFCIAGKNYPLNPTTQSFGQSSRDGLFIGGIGWDFQVQRIWFYNLGRRAVVAEDLWDGDFLECKFHEIGVDKTFAPGDLAPQAMVFKRKVDSCNAVRITSCHFEHCYRGAISIQDLCYSFFLSGNKFEAQNQNTDYPAEYVIYVGNNHRNFVWEGGMAVVTQQRNYLHYARIWGDATTVRDVKFTYPNNNGGAALLDLSYGNYQVGATISISGDVRGDLSDASGNPVAPILSRTGRNDFSGTQLKVYNPGLVFSLASSANSDDVSKVRILGIGTAVSRPIVHVANAIHRINGLRYSGVAYTSLHDAITKADREEYAMLYNLSTTVTFNIGDTVASSSLAPAAATGENSGASAAVAGTWVCMGYCPPNKVSLFKRIS
ncbi:tail fiber protein [Klebsiella phage VLCpiA1i]|nr:tail fiber protein [Klebsiella phage VLCpiA1i]